MAAGDKLLDDEAAKGVREVEVPRAGEIVRCGDVGRRRVGGVFAGNTGESQIARDVATI